jgi:hypothetical protein
MKIAKLEFQISDYTGTKSSGIGAWEKDRDKYQDNLCDSSDVEEDVNNTLHLLEKNGSEIIDVRTDFVTVQTHNNGGCDTVFEYVTILYK